MRIFSGVVVVWLVAAVASAQVGDEDISLTIHCRQGDLRVNGELVSTNYETVCVSIGEHIPNGFQDNTLACGNAWASPGGDGDQRRSLLSFDVSELAGRLWTRSYTVTNTVLVLECYAQLNEMTHVLCETAPFVHGATWNNPSGDGDAGDETPGGTVGAELGRHWIKNELGTKQWPSSSNFVLAVTRALDRTDHTLYLVLKEGWQSNQDFFGEFRPPGYGTFTERPRLTVGVIAGPERGTLLVVR